MNEGDAVPAAGEPCAVVSDGRGDTCREYLKAALVQYEGQDVVLVGISRVAKSTTCFYLGYNGIKAANVPLVVGVPLFRELVQLDPRKAIGLRMNVTRLMAVRAARARHLNAAGTEAYMDKRQIADEVGQAHGLMQQQGWRSFDVSYMEPVPKS